MSEAPIDILLIEDEDPIREMFEEHFTAAGYAVRACATGEAGILEQEKRPADIVFTDIVMKGMSGMEVLQRVRAQWPATEVVLITGNATVETAVEALRHGAYDFLLKPTRLPQIDRVIERCAERIRFSRENRELRRVVEQLTQLNRQREKFVALANHELRTPATAAHGILSLLRQRGLDLPPEQEELLERAEESLATLSRIVEDLGVLSLGGCRPSREPVLLGDLLGEIQRVCREYAARRELAVEVDPFPAPERAARLDRPLMMRAVHALIRNAVQFTPDGGAIRVGLGEEEGRVRITVSDTGVGIPEAEQETVFEPFYTVGDPLHHRSTTHEFGGGGIGIGLPLARAVAEAHGGTLVHEPRSGGGSVFILSIPV